MPKMGSVMSEKPARFGPGFFGREGTATMQILFATDGSKEAEAAARLLAGLRLTKADTITLLHVLPSGDVRSGAEGVPPPYPAEVESALSAARDLLAGTGVSLRTEVRRGHPAHEIREAAVESQADLLAVGACGHAAIQRFLLGSVAERLVRYGPCPVLVARPLSATLRRVILGIDDSPGSGDAAQWLRRFPLPEACEVRLVTVLPLLDNWLRAPMALTPPLVEEFETLADLERGRAQERLHDLAATLRVGGKQTVTELRSGDPALGILQVAEEEGADLIVVGSHGQGAAERFLIGSVSEKVVRHAPCSVLVVR
jgi:nucleotide-binding universal stress UspA family protein